MKHSALREFVNRYDQIYNHWTPDWLTNIIIGKIKNFFGFKLNFNGMNAKTFYSIFKSIGRIYRIIRSS